MESSIDFAKTRLEETLTEIHELRSRYHELSLQLSDAETALQFYGNPTNYRIALALNPENLHPCQNILQDDFDGSDNKVKAIIAGKRSRDYFKKYARE